MSREGDGEDGEKGLDGLADSEGRGLREVTGGRGY